MDACDPDGMRYEDPDLELIKPLLTEAPWRALGQSPEKARWLALVCALAWLTGAGTREMSRLCVSEWMPDGQVAVLLTRTRATEWKNEVRPARPRLIPALPSLRRAVERRLGDMPNAGPNALLLSLSAPWDREARGSIDVTAKLIARATSGKVGSLNDLVARYRYYLECSGADPKVVRWARGSIGRALDVTFAELPEGSRDYEPPLSAIKRLLLDWHPAA